MSVARATIFPDISDKDLKQKLFCLMNKDGLLDMVSIACGDPGRWCFESEIVVYKKGERDYHYKNIPNIVLRDAIRKMLKPFEAEEPMYAHPKPKPILSLSL